MARPRSNIEPRLIAAARARFLRDGVDGASLREIARAAGTSVGMVHYYFPDKDRFFLAVVEERYAGFSDALTRIMSAAEPFEDRVRALYARLAEASDEELDVLRLVIREVLVSSTRRRLLVERFLRGHVPPVVGALLDAQRAGEIDARHPLPAVALSIAAGAIFPQVVRRVVAELRGGLPFPMPEPTDLATAVVDVLLDGVRPGRRRPRRRS
jgi:AcrR family transcriptional regulator